MKKIIAISTIALSALSSNAQNQSATFVEEANARFDEKMVVVKEKETELRQMLQGMQGKQMPQDVREKADSIYKIYLEANNEAIEVIKAALTAHSDDAASVELISRYQRQLGLEYLSEFLATYKFADAEALAPIREAIAIEDQKKPGALLIDFEMPDEAGVQHKLSEYVGKGKYVLVDFWASWCGPCRAEMPNVKATYERFHAKGFDILGLSFDNSREAWLGGIADLGMTWPQLSDLQGWKSIAAQKYGVHAIPFTILFDKEGRIIATNLRGEALPGKLSELLGE